jgi:hypothetical protein
VILPDTAARVKRPGTRRCRAPAARCILAPAEGYLVKNNPDLLTQIMAFLSTIAGYLGTWIILLVQKILPSATNLPDLKEPIGYMAILTIFTILASITRKVALIILAVGWVLILLRIILMAFKI